MTERDDESAVERAAEGRFGGAAGHVEEHASDHTSDPRADDPGDDAGADVGADYGDDLVDDSPHPPADDQSAGTGRSLSTGHPAVDEVLRSLDGLDGRPVDEHVQAFEHAHEVLRQALSSAGDDTVSRPEG